VDSNLGIIIYLVFGLGFYVALSMSRWDSFKGSDWKSIARGVVFGWILWPLAILLYKEWRLNEKK